MLRIINLTQNIITELIKKKKNQEMGGEIN